MPQEPEAIRQEMDETRSSLTEKINVLEQQVVGTVHDASTGVKETIEKVKDAVEESVEKVKETVGETVDSVKETFSIRNQVERHPWVAMGASAGVGFVAGYMLYAPTRVASSSPGPMPNMPKRSGNGSHREPMRSGLSGDFSAERSSSAVEQLTEAFECEIEQIKGLAIGTLAGIVRDLVVTSVPQMMRNPLREVFNDMTIKLGGQAIPGRILSDDWHLGASDASDDDRQQEPPFRNPRQTSYTPH
jgi:ElaB/YqjD/DUF883 family membrane-anchored ribosome-binding protein